MNLIKKLPRLFFLNCLWLAGSLPVITAGISTCAAYAVALRLADDDEEVETYGGIFHRYIKAFRQDLLQGFLILIFTLIGAGAGVFFAYLAWDSGLNLIKIGLLLLYFLVVLVFNLYSYPLIARYSNTFINTLRNSVALFAQYPNSSLKTLGLVVLELILLYLSRYFFFIGFILLPSVIIYTVSITAKDIFVQLENQTS